MQELSGKSNKDFSLEKALKRRGESFCHSLYCL